MKKIDCPELLNIIFENRKMELGVVSEPSSPVEGSSEMQPATAVDLAQLLQIMMKDSTVRDERWAILFQAQADKEDKTATMGVENKKIKLTVEVKKEKLRLTMKAEKERFRLEMEAEKEKVSFAMEAEKEKVRKEEREADREERLQKENKKEN